MERITPNNEDSTRSDHMSAIPSLHTEIHPSPSSMKGSAGRLPSETRNRFSNQYFHDGFRFLCMLCVVCGLMEQVNHGQSEPLTNILVLAFQLNDLQYRNDAIQQRLHHLSLKKEVRKEQLQRQPLTSKVSLSSRQQIPPFNGSSRTELKSTKVNEDFMTTTTSAPSNQSKRLSKAKLLLEQFQETEMMNGDVIGSTAITSTGLESTLGMEDTVSDIASDKFASNMDYKISTKKGRTTMASRIRVERKDEIENNPINIVPDNYWRNGHLMDTYSSGIGGESISMTFNKNNKINQPNRGASEGTPIAGSFVTRWARGANVAEPLVQYDPIKAEKLLFRQPTKWVVRNFQIAVPLGWWAVNVVLDYIADQFTSNIITNNSDRRGGSAKSSRRRERAKQLTAAISSLGPAIIKGGQALASRPDLLPAEYLQELQALQDDVPRFSNELAIQTVERELRIQKFTDVFELIQDEPVAAASIGQVYKARLVENGDIVALKIQRPSCEEIVALDLYILRWWSGIYNFMIYNILRRDINLQSIIDDFGILIYRELDYVAEASNAQRFNELYAGITPDVFVPKIYSDYTTSRVLTMEWVDGYRITDRSTMKLYNLDERKLVNTLVQCSVRQILENGFFHADPHAGNLLACPDGRLCYLDFGMMSYANQKQRNGFLLAVIHIVNRDWDELAKLYVRLGFIPQGTDLEPIVQALDQALPDVLNADISELNFKNVINSLGDVFYTFPFSLPPFYIAIIRCLGVLEGLAIQVDPSIKVISECYPYVASRVLTDRQDDLQEAFRRLALTNDGKVRWERLEGLLDKAKGVSDYDAAAALELFTDYLLSDESGTLLDDLAIQLVQYTDNLGSEASRYLILAIQAFSINDEVAAVRAFRSISEILQVQREDGFDSARQRISNELRDTLPELTPSMKRLARIASLLLGTTSDPSPVSATRSNKKPQQQDPTKFVPIIRKLAASPKVQKSATEVIARLGERMLSRGLRAAFGLPPPTTLGLKSSFSTVTEDRKL